VLGVAESTIRNDCARDAQNLRTTRALLAQSIRTIGVRRASSLTRRVRCLARSILTRRPPAPRPTRR
jgi:hypothetical protein